MVTVEKSFVNYTHFLGFYTLTFKSYKEYSNIIEKLKIKYEDFMAIINANNGHIDIPTRYICFSYISEAENALDTLEALLVMNKLKGGG